MRAIAAALTCAAAPALALPGNLDVAGVALGPTNAVTRRIEMSSLDTPGYFTVHGFMDTVGDAPVPMLLRNDSPGDADDYPTLLFRPITSSRVFAVRFASSGVIHVANPDARVWFLVPVTEDRRPVTITKTGAGILHFGANYPAFGMNTTTGGLILEEGSLRTNRNSIITDGVMTASPFGLGPVTLRGGALQSSTSVARTFDNPFILDGNVTVGSPTRADYNATITLRGDAGTTTTLVRDSTLTVHNTTHWNQPITGDFRLTKRGGGTLVLGGSDNSFAALSVLDGVVSVGSSTSGTMPANPPASGGTMADHILLDGGTLQFTGSWSGTPMGARRGIALGEAGGTLEVTGGYVVQTNAPMADAGPSPGSFIKTGSGTFGLNSASAGAFHTGPTRVEGGRFFMNSLLAYSPAEVAAGATLAGLGTFGREITVRAGAILAPGGRTTTGIMVAGDALHMESGANLAFRINGTLPGPEHDQLVVSHPQALAGVNLELTLGFQPNLHDTFVLIGNQSPGLVSGPLVFNGVPLGEGAEFLVESGEFAQEFTISYGYSAGGLQNCVAIFAGSPPSPGAGTYATWREARFGNSTDPAGDPLAQPSGQSAHNLMLHALAIDLADEPAEALPRALAGGVLTFTRRTPLGTRLVVEATSGNPSGNWQQLAVLEPGASTWTGPAHVAEAPAGTGRMRAAVTDPGPDLTGVRLFRVRGLLPGTIMVGPQEWVSSEVTAAETPVVPMWNAPMPTTDRANGAGFPVLSNAEHAVVWQPATLEDGAYNHYAALIVHKGRFFAMWGNHRFAEDAPGQRILFAHSDQWGAWSPATELFPAPGPVLDRPETGIHLKADRWVQVDGRLFAVVYVHGAGRYPIAREVTIDGSMGAPFLVRGLPAGAGLPEYMAGHQQSPDTEALAAKILQAYADQHAVSWWAWSGEGAPRTGVDGASLIESFSYRARDGRFVLFLRDWGTTANPVHTNRLYVCFSNILGDWSPAYPTNIPDSPSRAQALTLSDGTTLLIGNQNAPVFDTALYLVRDPITVAISADGLSFDRVFALRTGAPTSYRFAGISGRNLGFAYSSSLIHDGWLYTFYSIGKEDMGITRVRLADLGL